MFDSQMIAQHERYQDLRREADTYRATRTTTSRPWRWFMRPERRTSVRGARPLRPSTAV